MPSTPLFTDNFRSHRYIDGIQTFYAHTGKIASMKAIHDLDYEKVMAFIEITYADAVQTVHRKDAYGRRTTTDDGCENILYLFREPLLIDVEDNGAVGILYLPETEALADEILAAVRKIRRRRRSKEPSYQLVATGTHGPYLRSLTLPKKLADFTAHYNDDLVALHPDIVKGLRKKEESGLYLFHGQPGTGKSTYLRHLIGAIRTKDFIFLSPRLAANLDTPELVNILIESPETILIIEDAEELLTSRDTGRNNAVSLLLNLTDGLLGESLHIQVVCTFNTPPSALDKALLRKGRLKTLYEFGPLAADKAAALLSSLKGAPAAETGPMSLADIYNWDGPDFEAPTRTARIGFGAKTQG